jgi:hypothetical protein
MLHGSRLTPCGFLPCVLQASELIIVLEWAQGGDLACQIKEHADRAEYFSVEQIWRHFYQVRACVGRKVLSGCITLAVQSTSMWGSNAT